MVYLPFVLTAISIFFFFILNFLERLLEPQNLLTRFFNAIDNRLNDLLNSIGILNDRHIDAYLSYHDTIVYPTEI